MSLTKAKMIDVYETMVKIRMFEDKVAELFSAGKLPGFVHLLDVRSDGAQVEIVVDRTAEAGRRLGDGHLGLDLANHVDTCLVAGPHGIGELVAQLGLDAHPSPPSVPKTIQTGPPATSAVCTEKVLATART